MKTIVPCVYVHIYFVAGRRALRLAEVDRCRHGNPVGVTGDPVSKQCAQRTVAPAQRAARPDIVVGGSSLPHSVSAEPICKRRMAPCSIYA
jgi:hypothetical protein